MRNNRWTPVLTMVAIMAGGITGAVSLSADTVADHGPIAWSDSLGTAKTLAAKDHKLIFVDFWAPWCGPCKLMLKTTYQDKQVVERSKRFVPVLLNYDKETAVVKRYKVGQLPVILFLDAKGTVLKRCGLMDAKAMLKAMDEVTRKRK